MNPVAVAVKPIIPLPKLNVEVNGVPLDTRSILALGEVRVQQRLSLPAQCELTFRDPPGALDSISVLTPGTRLRVLVDGQSEPLFNGEVTAIEHVYEPAHGHEVRVRGYDLLHRLRKRQAVRAHVQVTVRDLAQDLVSDLGLSVQAEDPGPLWQRLIQHRQSDLDLLTEVAEQCGLYLALDGDVLHLVTLQGRGDALPLRLGETLLETRIELNGDPACRSVAATGWDALRVQTHRGRAASARVGRKVPAEVPPGQVGGSGQRDLVNEALQDDRHAEGLAQAELDLRVAREVTFWGMADGDPRLRPGTAVEIAGVAESLTGRYVLTSVTHTLDQRLGFVSELSSAPPTPRPWAVGPSATLGVVTRVDDPDNLGRVRVSLPAFENVETEWMGVLSPGGGAKKGLMVLPDVGDQVLVWLAHADPGQGIVLGGLYGVNGFPDSGVEGKAVRRYTLLTPGGQRVQLDDAKRTIRLENSQGSSVELAPNRVTVHAASDLVIEAPGHTITVRGQAIDFQKG